MKDGGKIHAVFEAYPGTESHKQIRLDSKAVIAEQTLATYLGAIGVTESQLIPNNVIDLFRSTEDRS